MRGTGFFYALELVKDKESRETFTDEECEGLLRGFLSNGLFERGLICRADDRGDPVVQISPPLVAGPEEFDGIAGILGDVLAEAATLMRSRSTTAGDRLRPVYQLANSLPDGDDGAPLDTAVRRHPTAWPMRERAWRRVGSTVRAVAYEARPHQRVPEPRPDDAHVASRRRVEPPRS